MAMMFEKLAALGKDKRHLRIEELFRSDPQRTDWLCKHAAGLTIDFSKQRIDHAILECLLTIAEESDLSSWIERLFSGDLINCTENRAALHTALRADTLAAPSAADCAVIQEVSETRHKLRDLCAKLESQTFIGYTGRPIRHVVNLGIGGSDLGPRMAIAALAPFRTGSVSVDCVSNIDAGDLLPTLSRLDPATTAFIVSSKSFTTVETLQNAATARDWLERAAGRSLCRYVMERHFIGVTTNLRRARDFGIPDDNILTFAEWVGGRFSLWSAIGLPIALSVGFDHYDELLAGAREMDRHFRTTPLADNLPVLMALAGIWNINGLGAHSLAIAPYSQSLKLLPAYLQQLEMESNGKCVGRKGQPFEFDTAPIIFGEAGTNAQHAYFQLLHQGTRVIPTDFIAIAQSEYEHGDHQISLLANCLAQASALAFGQRHASEPHKTCRGNQPSTTIVLPRLTPYYLGMLLALYEHKVFVQGILWNINSFDQWGVELGKSIANQLQESLSGRCDTSQFDPSTAKLIAHLRMARNADRQSTPAVHMTANCPTGKQLESLQHVA